MVLRVCPREDPLTFDCMYRLTQRSKPSSRSAHASIVSLNTPLCPSLLYRNGIYLLKAKMKRNMCAGLPLSHTHTTHTHRHMVDLEKGESRVLESKLLVVIVVLILALVVVVVAARPTSLSNVKTTNSRRCTMTQFSALSGSVDRNQQQRTYRCHDRVCHFFFVHV